MRGLNKVTKIAVVSAGLLALVLGGLLAACQSTAETQVEARPEVNCTLPQEIETMEQTEHNVLSNPVIPPIDASAPAKTETATFSLGWFWGPDSRFGSTPGVVRTRVGYAGGMQKDPTYYKLGDHTETIQIDYDPTQISYQELLAIFWDNHNPARPPFSRQYKSIIFYHNDEQKKLALETKARVEAELKADVLTEIIPASEFYLAEAYHQKYYLQGVPVFKQEFGAFYPDTNDFIASTSAARVNGYLGGNGTVASLQAEIESFGLSPQASQKLLDIVSSLKN